MMLKSLLVYSVLSASALALTINPEAASGVEPRGQDVENRNVVMKDILRRNQDGSPMQLRNQKRRSNLFAVLPSPSPSPGPSNPGNNNNNNDDDDDDPDNTNNPGTSDPSPNDDPSSDPTNGGDSSSDSGNVSGAGDDADGVGALTSVSLGTLLVLPAAALVAVGML